MKALQPAGHGKDLSRIQLKIPLNCFKDWDQLRREVGDLHDWKCERCDKQLLFPSQQAPKRESYQLRANVHHKDRDRTNSEWENLELLCPSCHLGEHKKERFISAPPGQLSLF